MFKFIRTINGNNNFPETMTLTLESSFLKDLVIEKNTVCTTDNSGYLVNEIIEGAPKYIPIEGKEIDITTKNTIKCMRVSSGMIFETYCDTETSKLRPGYRVALGKNVMGTLDHVTTEPGNDAEVIYVDPNNTSKKVFIALL